MAQHAPVADEHANRDSFRIQADYCTAMAAPVTARVCTGLADALTRDTRTGTRAVDWPGEPVADALALRLVGGLHALHRTGADAELSAVFEGRTTEGVAGVLAGVLLRHDAALLAWLDGPPQTNEAGRSAGLMCGLLHLAERFGARVELLEIGSSAGLNLLIDRYRFDLGGTIVGPEDAALAIVPEWRGAPPPQVPIAIVGVRGVDIAPVDAATPRRRHGWRPMSGSMRRSGCDGWRPRSRWSRDTASGWSRATPPTGSRRSSPNRSPRA